MHISFMICNDLSHGGGHREVSNPTWPKIEKAIRQLDGIYHTQVSLMVREAEGMMVSGGYQNRYLCEVVSHQGSSFVVGNTKSRKKAVQLIKDEPSDFSDYHTASLVLLCLS